MFGHVHRLQALCQQEYCSIPIHGSKCLGELEAWPHDPKRHCLLNAVENGEAKESPPQEGQLHFQEQCVQIRVLEAEKLALDWMTSE
jgi:hypothetical protein